MNLQAFLSCLARASWAGHWTLALIVAVLSTVSQAQTPTDQAELSQLRCRPALEVLGPPEVRAYQALLVGDVLLIDENEANQKTVYGGSTMTVRESLYIQMDAAENAVTYADDAIARGELTESRKHQYVVELRRKYYLSLSQHHAQAMTVGLLQPNHRIGIPASLLLTRRYEFPNESRDGEMAAASEVCVEASGLLLTLFPEGAEVSAATLLKKPETPNCRNFKDPATPCGSLTDQLAVIKAAKERIVAIGRASSSVYLVTLGPMERGRILWIDADGTAVVSHRFANAYVHR